MEQQLILYEDQTNNTIPFTTWLNNLRDRRAANAIKSKLNKLRQGNFGDCKFIKEGVWELRLHYAKGYRVYFGRFSQQFVVLLWGGIKSTQQKDINRAVIYWKTFKEEQKNEH